VEKVKTRLLCIIYIFSENRAVHEIMWNNSVEATDKSIIRRRKYAIVLPDNKGKNADAHSKYLVVIFIVAPCIL